MFIDVQLDNSVHFETCLDVVVLCAEEGVSRCFRPQPLNAAPLNLVPTTSVIAGGRGYSLPARLAVGFNAITVCAADTPPRLQRPIAESRHDCSDSSHLSGINDVTPAAFGIEAQCSTYRGHFHSWQILCQQVSGVLLYWDFGHLNFAFSHQVLKPQHCNIDVSDLPKACSLADSLARAAVGQHSE